MMERKDMHVVEPTEPFINLYYNGPEKRSGRNLHQDVASEPNTLRGIGKLMMEPIPAHASPDKKYVFSKNMAYYLADRMKTKTMEMLFGAGTNAFIVRHPQAALASHFKQDPDFTWEEAGYQDLREMFDIVSSDFHQAAPVIDGDEFCRAPILMMRKLCTALGIPFDEKSMQWEAGQVKSFDGYGSWTEVAENSKGFIAPPEKLPDISSLPLTVGKMVERARKHYDYVMQFALRPDTPDTAKAPDDQGLA